MPIFLVRWPDARASLISARNVSELRWIIDDERDTTGCTWSVYRGPIAIHFDLNVSYEIRPEDEDPLLKPSEIVVTDVAKLQRYDFFSLAMPDNRASEEMREVVLQGAFPKVASVVDAPRRSSQARLKRAVWEELQRLVARSWTKRKLARRTDRLAEIARQMGSPIELVEDVAYDGEPPPRAPGEVLALTKKRRASRGRRPVGRKPRAPR